MKVKTDYEGCEYITAGKEYEVTDEVTLDIHMPTIVGDDELVKILFLDSCCHLAGLAWEVLE